MPTPIAIPSPAWIADQIAAKPTSVLGKAVRDAAGAQAAARTRAVSLTRLPALLFNRRRWTQSAYSQDAVTTTPDGVQLVTGLVTVTNGERHWHLFRRPVGTTRWTSVDLGLVSAGFIQQPADANGANDDDSHNVVNVAVSSDGHIHVIGNMHSHPLRYVCTQTPGDITTFAANTIPGTSSLRFTYPQLFLSPTGRLILAFRDGLATSGDEYLVAYAGARTWGNPTKLMDGQSNSEGAYLHRIAVRDGKVGIFFMIRGSGDASTNKGLYYVESVDDLATWRRADGTAQALPISSATGDRFQVIGEAAGLINQGGADLDSSLYPHAAIQLYDAAGKTQLHHIYRDATGWHDDQVTDWTQRVETVGATTLDLQVARPHLFCVGTRTYLLARTSAEGFQGAPVLIDATPGADHTPVKLMDLDLYGWEPAIDSRALRERNELNMLVTPIDHNSDSKVGWERQAAWIMRLDLAQLPAIQSGAANVARIRTVDRREVAKEVTILAGSTTDAAVAAVLPVLPLPNGRDFGPGSQVFYRLTGEIYLSGTTGGATLCYFETPVGGALPSNEVTKLVLANSSLGGILGSPWEPAPGTPYVETSGAARSTRLAPRVALLNSAAGIVIRSLQIEVGVLDPG